MAGRRPAKPEDTARQSERLKDEAEVEQRDRSSELSMISKINQADEQDGVWDGESGELLDAGLSPEVEKKLARHVEKVKDPDAIIEPDEAQLDLTAEHKPVGAQTVGPLGTPIPEPEEDDVRELSSPQAHSREVQTVERADKYVVCRINADCDPTIGQLADSNGNGPHWHFLRGKRYRVPQHVADHLNEKGLVAQWG